MGGALLSGGLRSFGLLHCGIRSRRHCGARMAAPGTAIVENERDGQYWGRHLPHGVTVAQLLGSNLESGDEREMRSTLEVVMKKGFILNSSTRRLLVVELFNLQNPNCKGIKFC